MTDSKSNSFVISSEQLAYTMRGVLHKHGVGSESARLMITFAHAAFKVHDFEGHFDYSTLWAEIAQKAAAADKWTELRTYLRMADSVHALKAPESNVFPALLERNLKGAVVSITLDQEQVTEELNQAHRFYGKFSKSLMTQTLTAAILQNFAETIITTPSITDDETVELAKTYIEQLKENGFYKAPASQGVFTLRAQPD